MLHSNMAGMPDTAPVSGVAGMARRMWLRANASRSLMRLNDQTLEDIGLSREKVRKTLLNASIRDLRSLLFRH